jgi:glycosyltransferase involved in cell wall biosynthesis
MKEKDSLTFKMAMVVPCYNEEKRFKLESWNELISATNEVEWIFVNDGSTDNTKKLLEEIKKYSSASVIHLPINAGKAEALRIGFIEAISKNCQVMGMIDADDSFKIEEVLKYIKRFQVQSEWISFGEYYAAIFMARNTTFKGLLESRILGRLIGLTISKMNRMAWPQLPKDTQCGFKFFKRNESFVSAMNQPFLQPWFFEIELLIRCSTGTSANLHIREVSLDFSANVEGSKTNRLNLLSTGKQVIMIFLRIIAFRLRSAINSCY